MGEVMTKLKTFVVLALSVAVTLLVACAPSYPTHTPPSNIIKHGATTQYSFFSSTQIQYPGTNTKDASINRYDNGGSAGDTNTGGETGFVFDF